MEGLTPIIIVANTISRVLVTRILCKKWIEALELDLIFVRLQVPGRIYSLLLRWQGHFQWIQDGVGYETITTAALYEIFFLRALALVSKGVMIAQAFAVKLHVYHAD